MTDRRSDPRYVLSVLGPDRPGIVSKVSRAMTDAGCNIEDSTMRLLDGAFSVAAIVRVPPGTENAFRTALVGITATQGLRIQVDPYPEDDEGLRRVVEGDRYTLTVEGADRPGIVAAVAEVLARESINLVDLSIRVIDGTPPACVMAGDVVAPGSADIDGVRSRLADLGPTISCSIELTAHGPVQTDGTV